MPKKQQTNIKNFFGAASDKPKKKNPQTKLDSFFSKKGAAAAAAADKSPTNKRKKNDVSKTFGKENSNSEEETTKKLTSKRNSNDRKIKSNDNDASAKSKKEASKRRRLAIEDDSDEEQEFVDNSSVKTDKDDNSPMEDADDKAKNNKTNDDADEDSKPAAMNDNDNKKSAENTDEKDDEEDDDGDVDMPDADGKDDSKPDTEKPKGEAAAATAEKTATKSESVKPASKPKASKTDNKAGTDSLEYSELCDVFDKIEGISGRLEIQAIVTDLVRKQIDEGNADSLFERLRDLTYLLCNQVAPACDNVELGVGDAILIKAISDAYGTQKAIVKQKYEAEGDLGSVAQSSKKKQKTLGSFFTSNTVTKPLTCHEVLQTLKRIAQTSGKDSQKIKTDSIKKMLVKVTQGKESQAKFIIRALQGRLRIGLAESTVLKSLAHALALSVPPKAKDAMKAIKGESNEDYPSEVKEYLLKKSAKDKKGMLAAAEDIIKKAYSEVPSFDKLVEAALTVPLQELHKECTLTPGIPVVPMLAKPTKSVQEVLKRLNGQRFTLEYKYDGERAQVHILQDGKSKVFSRNLLDTSEKYPEATKYVEEAADDSVKSCVLDTEVVAYDQKKDKLVPFQVLSTRKKTEDSADTATVQVIVQAFDLMYLNGESLLSKTLQQRRDLMYKHFSPVTGKFCFAVSLDYEEDGDSSRIEEFLDQAIKGQCEGLMVKALDGDNGYEPSKRTFNWLKLKKDYLEGMGDTFDLVPIGAFYGKGKRTGFYGAYLLACYDPETEEFQSVCKIGTGFSDEDLKSLAESLNEHKIPQKTSQYNVSDQLECDVWFDAVQVWEAKAADLSKSSAHRGAIGKIEEGRGIGLRFPRFERLRDDKKPDQATTAAQVLEMYYNQDTVNGGDGEASDDEDGI
ncbi:DNA ligase 1 [Seminavis robusta]|uniref:DNA ligase n=1 Tax=Seminavis robusta TaxID=568900 RepID=A0A9N8HRS3_9STRA|nr:DNA ligase 1 [Seminavis robusta]|eukprot:Sro1100_g241250.1 DNA ligase 1 (906) ;mRNA; r:9315-12032